MPGDAARRAKQVAVDVPLLALPQDDGSLLLHLPAENAGGIIIYRLTPRCVVALGRIMAKAVRTRGT